MITTVTAGNAADDVGWVLMLARDGDVRAFALPERGEVVIGRDPACAVAVDNTSVSRRHTRLVIADGWTVEDLGSHNGTSVAGKRLGRGDAAAVGAGEPFAVGPFAAVILPRPVSNVRKVVGSSSIVIEDPTLPNPLPSLTALAKSAVNVVVQGETGTGKEVLSRALHALSGRAGALVAINCAAIAPQLLESELFGHEKGAFTGATDTKVGLLAAAAGGTVLLDEIAEMPLELQAKMLRVIDSREVRRVGAIRGEPIDVRVIAASHRDLAAASEAGTFRRDLYYRLAGVTLVVPPLRERRGQIAVLAARFAKVAAGARAVPPFSPQVVARLSAHDWPGNVRELKNVIERAVLLAGGGALAPEHILFDTPSPPAATAASAGAAAAPPPPNLSADDLAWRDRIIAALDACAGNQTTAAKRLGISRSNLAHKLVLYAIPRPRKQS